MSLTAFDSFSLPFVLRALAMAKETGRLLAQSAKGSGAIYLRDGAVYHAIAHSKQLEALDGQIDADPSARDLLPDVAADHDDIVAAYKLVPAGASVTDEHRPRLMPHLLITGAACTILSWQQGEYRWDADIVIDAGAVPAMPVERIILQAARQVDPHELRASAAPDGRLMLSVASGPFSGVLDMRLTREERQILALIDGRHTVGDVVAVSEFDERSTLRTLYGLIAAGLVEAADPAENGSSRRDLPEERRTTSRASSYAVTSERQSPAGEPVSAPSEPLEENAAPVAVARPNTAQTLADEASAAAPEERQRRRQKRAKVQSAFSLRQAVQTFMPFMRPHWPGFLAALLAAFGISLIGLLKPWPLKFLFDSILGVEQVALPANPALAITAVAGAIVGIALVQGLLSFGKQFFLSVTSQRVAFGLRSAVFGHIQRLPLAFHDRQRTGDMITRVTNDVTRIQELITDDLLLGGVTSSVQLIGMLVVMLVIDPLLGLVAALSAPLILFSTLYFRGRIRAEEQQVREKEGDIASLAQETIASIKVVKAFGRSDFEARRFEEQTGEMLEASVKVSRLEAGFAWTLNIITACSLAMLVGLGANQVLAGALSAGTLIVFIQYMRDLQSPLTSLSRMSAKFAKATIRAERLMEILRERPAVEERPDARTAPRFRGQIQFEHVSFGYASDTPVLRDINFTIEPGEMVAIVGATGAGKSTLASLLLRLYDPTSGAVRIDGHDIRDFKLDSLLDQIGIVLQESLLFQTTIRENIAYGKPHASMREIEQAARLAYCDEFIAKLPKGFDTIVGERGGTLSGGQRQRIAIARAIIRDAPILVLDEPTTGLDAQAEESVMRALEQLVQGRTTLMIAHKLSTVRRASKIIVMEGGSISEAGVHAELLASGGSYARAVQLQTA